MRAQSGHYRAVRVWPWVAVPRYNKRSGADDTNNEVTWPLHRSCIQIRPADNSCTSSCTYSNIRTTSHTAYFCWKDLADAVIPSRPLLLGDSGPAGRYVTVGLASTSGPPLPCLFAFSIAISTMQLSSCTLHIHPDIVQPCIHEMY